MAENKSIGWDNYSALEIELHNAHKNNAPDADIRNLFKRMEQLAKDGDEHAMSFIEKAKLATSSEHIKANPVYVNGAVHSMTEASSPGQKNVGNSDYLGLWKPANK